MHLLSVQIQWMTFMKTLTITIQTDKEKELENIAINHSADISERFCEDLQIIHKKPYSFLTTDTTLPASDPLRVRKKLLHSYKNDNNRSV